MQEKGFRKILWFLLVPIWYLVVWLPEILLEFGRTINRKIIIIQEKFDPLPKHKKGETTEEWLKRIDLKYALRYATFMQLCYFNLDEKEMVEKMKMQKNKADKKFIKDVYKLLTLHNVRGQEHYQQVMARKEFEEKVKETQRG